MVGCRVALVAWLVVVVGCLVGGSWRCTFPKELLVVGVDGVSLCCYAFQHSWLLSRCAEDHPHM